MGVRGPVSQDRRQRPSGTAGLPLWVLAMDTGRRKRDGLASREAGPCPRVRPKEVWSLSDPLQIGDRGLLPETILATAPSR